ncbi:hypothetical protein CLF_109212 [Clonorchis sinensis]|uniref:Uncharacterized protein n=1 Tax=Clonorchis sinensis TaxID=79923 RepID=G7YJ20_CLOSI|nr:hypothetical protein CLF_109212 [Clonorchis sinensis]
MDTDQHIALEDHFQDDHLQWNNADKSLLTKLVRTEFDKTAIFHLEGSTNESPPKEKPCHHSQPHSFLVVSPLGRFPPPSREAKKSEADRVLTRIRSIKTLQLLRLRYLKQLHLNHKPPKSIGWRKGVRWCKFERNKAQLEDRSLLTNPRYVCLLDRLHRFLDCLKVLRFLPTEAKVPLTVREFCDSVNHAAKFNSILLFEFLPVVSSVCQETRQRMRAEIQQLKESINILFGTVSKSTPLSELNTKQAQLQGRYARLCADFAAFPRLINRIKLEIVSCIWIAFNENVEEFVREKESDVAETPESIVARVLVRLVFQTGEQAHPTENARGKETRLRINPSPLLIKSLFSSAVQVLSSSTHLEELKRNFLLNQLSPEAIEEDSQRQTCRVSVESNIKLTDAETDMKTPEDSLIHSVPWNPAVPEGMDAEAEHIRGFLTEVIRSTERKPAKHEIGMRLSPNKNEASRGLLKIFQQPFEQCIASTFRPPNMVVLWKAKIETLQKRKWSAVKYALHDRKILVGRRLLVAFSFHHENLVSFLGFG